MLAPNVFTHGASGFSIRTRKAGTQRPQSGADVSRAIAAGSSFGLAAARDPVLYEEAIDCYGEALSGEPDNLKALRGRGSAYRMLSRHNEAVTDLSRAVGLEPDHLLTLTERAVALRALGRHDESAADLSRVLDSEPSYFFARRARGLTYRAAGRYVEAVADLDRAAKEQPADRLTRAERGEAYRSLYRNDEALADFDEAVMLDPDDAFSLRGRGSVYLSMGRFDAALADFDRALWLEHPRTLFSLCGRAGALAGHGRAGEADEVFDGALRAHPRSAYAHDRYGNFLSLDERYAQAHSEFDTAAALARGSGAEYLGHKALSLVRQGCYAEAVDAGTVALDADRGSRAALIGLGHALICLGQPEQARQYLDRAAEARAGREPLVLLAAIRWHDGDQTGATNLFERATRVADDCTAFRLAELLAIALTAVGRPDQAVEVATRAASWRLPGDVVESALYDLLDGPHLTGLGRVRRAIEPHREI